MMKSTTIAKGILKAVAILIVVVLLLLFLFKIKSVLAYVVVAAVIALMGRPIVLFFRRRLKMPDTLAVVITMMAILGLIIGLFLLFVPVLTEQGKNLTLLDLQSIQAELDKVYEKISHYFGTSQKVVEDIMQDVDLEKNVQEKLDKGAVPTLLNSLLGIISDFGVGLFSVLFISFFLLKDSKLIQRSLLLLVPDAHRAGTINSLAKTKHLLSRYFIGLLLQILILFGIYAITLVWVGVENAIVIAFLCSLFNIIPYIGPIIGAAIMMMLTMTSHIEMDFNEVILPKLGYVLIGVVVGQLVDNFFSQPYIFSNSVKSHPLEIFLIIIIAGLLFGIVGMMVAVPAYTVGKVVLKEFMADNKVVRALTKGL